MKNCRIVDGTGAPWFDGAVAIEDDQIAAVHREDDIEHDARETVDLDGLALAPGFIHLHSHSDLRLFAAPDLSPKTRQGVTTELLGQDGFSMAPMYPEGGPEECEDHLSGLNGRPEREWTWGSVTEYFDAIE